MTAQKLRLGECWRHALGDEAHNVVLDLGEFQFLVDTGEGPSLSLELYLRLHPERREAVKEAIRETLR